jgi:mannose-6-phosphate isomerase-like protein (cupin superfamily)
MTTTVPTSETLIDGPFGAHLLIAAGAFSLVEHPIAPRTLAAPSHVHQHEDEYSYVLEGEVGFEVGDEVFTAGAGQLVAKPRGICTRSGTPAASPRASSR